MKRTWVPQGENAPDSLAPVREPVASGWRQAHTPVVPATPVHLLAPRPVTTSEPRGGGWVQTRRASYQSILAEGGALLVSGREDGAPPLWTRTPCHPGMPSAPGLSCQWNLEGNPTEARRETGHRHLKARLRPSCFQAQPDGRGQDPFPSGCWPENSLPVVLSPGQPPQGASFLQSKGEGSGTSHCPCGTPRSDVPLCVLCSLCVKLVSRLSPHSGTWMARARGQAVGRWAPSWRLPGTGGMCLRCSREEIECGKATVWLPWRNSGVRQGGSRETFWEKLLFTETS